MTYEDSEPQNRQHWHAHKESRANLLSGFERRDIVADLRNMTAYPRLHFLADLLTAAAIIVFAVTCVVAALTMLKSVEALLAGLLTIACSAAAAVLLCIAAQLTHWVADLADMRIEKLIDRLQKRSKTP